jgi:Rod binding domain-containing protein
MALTDPMTLAPAPQPPQATPEQRRKIQDTAQAFEGQLLGLLMQPMFEGLQTDGPFGGGNSEGTYKAFLVEAIGKQVARAGGVGLADPVAREMLRMQGLS